MRKLIFCILLLLLAACDDKTATKRITWDFREDFGTEHMEWPPKATGNEFSDYGSFDFEVFWPTGQHTRAPAYFIGATRKDGKLWGASIHLSGRSTLDEIYPFTKKTMAEWQFDRASIDRLDQWYDIEKSITNGRSGIQLDYGIRLTVETSSAMKQGDDRCWGLLMNLDPSRTLYPAPDAPVEKIIWDFRQDFSPQRVHWPEKNKETFFSRNANIDLSVLLPNGTTIHEHVYKMTASKQNDAIISLNLELAPNITADQARDEARRILNLLSPMQPVDLDAWHDKAKAGGQPLVFSGENGPLSLRINPASPNDTPPLYWLSVSIDLRPRLRTGASNPINAE